jgi:hypothetical protein
MAAAVVIGFLTIWSQALKTRVAGNDHAPSFVPLLLVLRHDHLWTEPTSVFTVARLQRRAVYLVAGGAVKLSSSRLPHPLGNRGLLQGREDGLRVRNEAT